MYNLVGEKQIETAGRRLQDIYFAGIIAQEVFI